MYIVEYDLILDVCLFFEYVIDWILGVVSLFVLMDE